jgi:hypothetical protein
MTASRSPEPPGLSCRHWGASAIVTVNAVGFGGDSSIGAILGGHGWPAELGSGAAPG